MNNIVNITISHNILLGNPCILVVMAISLDSNHLLKHTCSSSTYPVGVPDDIGPPAGQSLLPHHKKKKVSDLISKKCCCHFVWNNILDRCISLFSQSECRWDYLYLRAGFADGSSKSLNRANSTWPQRASVWQISCFENMPIKSRFISFTS